MGFLFLELYSCTLYVVSQGPINQALRWEAVANGNQVIIKTHTTHTAWLFFDGTNHSICVGITTLFVLGFVFGMSFVLIIVLLCYHSPSSSHWFYSLTYERVCVRF